MKIGIGQLNTRVGDFAENAKKILDASKSFAEKGADFAVFPECTVSGYPLKDLVFYERFVHTAQQTMHALAKEIPLPIIVGCPSRENGAIGFRNTAYKLEGGRVQKLCSKYLLPNYGALNDARNFDSGDEFCVTEICGKKIGVTICEDIWTLPFVNTAARYVGKKLPLDYFASLNANGKRGLDLLVNISASVFSCGNDCVRCKGGLLWSVSEYVSAPLLWCNLVGGADEILFAGGSGIFEVEKDASSKIIGERSKCLKKFQEDCEVIDLEKISSYDGDKFDFQGDEDLRKALVLSLGDFMKKCGLKKALIGLSGGIDSALVAALAVEAMGRENVIGVSMPSKISSSHSKDDARALAENLGIEFHTVSIADIVEASEKSLSKIFEGKTRDVTEENIQSRSRGLVLMAISNKLGAAVLTTGNKSECAVGYCTLYGDTCGAFAPICDLYKTQVYSMCRHINATAGREIIPQNTIDKAPSAELRPDQKDEDSLPPYDLLDAILRLHIEEFKSASDIVAAGFQKEVVEEVLKKVAGSEYKRSQYPLGTKISTVAYGADRKISVAIRRGLQ